METLYFSKPTFAGQPDNNAILAECEIHFPAGSMLAGLKLTGVVIRRSKHLDRDPGGVFITFPAKGIGMGDERRYYDFVRSVDPMSSEEGKRALRALKDRIAREYKAWVAGQPKPASPAPAPPKADDVNNPPF